MMLLLTWLKVSLHARWRKARLVVLLARHGLIPHCRLWSVALRIIVRNILLSLLWNKLLLTWHKSGCLLRNEFRYTALAPLLSRKSIVGCIDGVRRDEFLCFLIKTYAAWCTKKLIRTRG